VLERRFVDAPDPGRRDSERFDVGGQFGSEGVCRWGQRRRRVRFRPVRNGLDVAGNVAACFDREGDAVPVSDRQIQLRIAADEDGLAVATRENPTFEPERGDCARTSFLARQLPAKNQRNLDRVVSQRRSRDPLDVGGGKRMHRSRQFAHILDVGNRPERDTFPAFHDRTGSIAPKDVEDEPTAEDASWLAGGKRIIVDRIEWLVMRDPAAAAAALQAGDVDWWEIATPSLVPTLRSNPDVMVDIQDAYGNVGVLAMNHLFPPFNDVRARRAILTAMSQEEYMRAFVGDDASAWKTQPGFFTPGSPFYNEDGGDILKGPRDLQAAKRLLAESGYTGAPVVCMAAQDVPQFKAWSEVTIDLLKRLDMKVDIAAVDWGAAVARRARKDPPGSGGWHMYHTSLAGLDCAAPTHAFVRANRAMEANGWADSAPSEREVAAWFYAPNLDEEMAAVRRLNKAGLDHVLYAPLGWHLNHTAWRGNLVGVKAGQLPVFWGVGKCG
jgi:peptide/nickel transport system substrate-binding protein